MYCKSNRYSYLHIDATGSVLQRLVNQSPCFFYSMVFKDNIPDDDDNNNLNSDPIGLMPLAGALLCDQTTCSISHFLNVVRSKLALRNSKRIRPSFVVIDFSAALLNAVLIAFNTENIKLTFATML